MNGGAITLGNGATFDSYASATWSATDNFTFSGGSRFKNQSGGIFDVKVDKNMTGGLVAGQFTNYGTFKKTAGQLSEQTEITVTFTNPGGAILLNASITKLTGFFSQSGGSTTLAGGNLSATVPITFTGGTLTGAGTITGNVYNNGGTLTLPASGVMNIVGGNYTQTSTGAMILNISAAGIYGSLSVQAAGGNGGGISLDGSITINRDSGYTPVNGTQLDFLTWETTGQNSTFATETIPSNSWNAGGVNNLKFNVVYDFATKKIYLLVAPAGADGGAGAG